MRGKGRGEIFKSTEVLNRMLSLRQQGVGPTELGKMFGVDHSTIIYHSKRYNIYTPIRRNVTVSGSNQVVMKILEPRIFVRKVIIEPVRYDEEGQRINPGRNYAEYAAFEQERKWNHLLKKTGTQCI